MSSNEWLTDKLGNIAGVQTGPFGSQLHNSDYVEIGTPIITVEHLGKRRLSRESMPYVCEEDRIRLDKYSLNSGDLVFSRVGSVDRCSHVSEEESGWLFSGRCLRVRPNTNVLDLKYIYYYFCLESVKKYIRSIAVGATMPSINTKILSEVNITFPQLTEQRAISATLSCLDDMIELNNRTNQVLEEMAQSIYKQWFVDFDFPNEDGQPYKSSGGEMVDSELGEIPKGWRVLTINDLCSKLASGGTPSTKISLNYVGDINWFSTKELKDNFLITSEKKINQNAIKTSAAKLFPPSTILMAIYAAPTVGRLGILTEESAFNQAAVGFISNDSVTCMEYLYLTLLNERINLNNLANGAAQQNLNVGIVKNYKIICPDIKVTLDFKRIVNRLFNKIKNNTIEIKILKEIRDTLLPKLMSGEIRVPLEEVE